MSKKNGFSPPPYGPPPSAPPSYSQAVGGVAPTSPFVPNHAFQNNVQIVTTVIPVGAENTHMICPHCHQEIDTSIKKEPGLIAYIAGIIICVMGCPFGCCLIPCCIDKCMDVHHTCPHCDAYLGRYRR